MLDSFASKVPNWTSAAPTARQYESQGQATKERRPWTKQLNDRALKVRYRRLFRSFRAQRNYPDLTRGDVPSLLAPGFHIAAPLALKSLIGLLRQGRRNQYRSSPRTRRPPESGIAYAC